MRTCILVAAGLALTVSAPRAQTGRVPASAGAASAEPAAHSFRIRDGRVYLDGRHLADAVPPGLDLSGYDGELTFSGPVSPLIEIDGAPFVLEADRLTPLAESSRAGNPVYIVDENGAGPSALPREQMRPIVEAAYMRDVAVADRTLYDQMRREADLEAEVVLLAGRLLALPVGDERAGLRRELRRQISDLLSLKHQIRAQEIDLAGRRLEAARQGLERRRGLHEAIVDGRLRELVGER